MRGSSPALIATLSLCLAVTACGASGEGTRRNGDAFILRGTVRVVGNEPFARLVLTVPNPEGGGRPADHVIKGSLAGDIGTRYQGKIITVECRYCSEPVPGHASCIEPGKILKVE